MSKPRYRWWSYACKMVQDYPKLKTAEQLSLDDQRDRDAVARAIEILLQSPNGEERIEFIKRVYWNGARIPVQNAAPHFYISEITAYRWHGDFIRLVGKCWGFDSGQPPKKRGPRPKKLEPPGQNGDRGGSLTKRLPRAREEKTGQK